MQGGPKADMIAARAVLFKECMTPQYMEYQRQVLKNSQALAEGCMEEGLKLVTNGTDNHLSTEGAQIRTEKVIRDLKEQFVKEEKK